MFSFVKRNKVYNKFIEEKVDIIIRKDIIDTVLLGVEIFTKFLNKELPETNNFNLKDDIKRMEQISDKLIRVNDGKEGEVTLNITVAEFLIFKYGIETVECLLLNFKIAKDDMEQYKVFIEALKEVYDTLDIGEISEYYRFLASFDKVERN
ncbi:hypothetical protein [Haloimpatiens massiliensis]|uniref:hypothetical protein n=1 Tax=Haloimpatiens massiliensis TaxID=1658110 RepID=UPI000C845A47|nr:hypothetical protein [Haloimpatiens massiliensis]